MEAAKPAWRAFWETVIRFDGNKVTPWLALRNTIGVGAPLGAGVVFGAPEIGIAVATGALNVCFSDGQEPYLHRARRMLAACGLVALAVFGGSMAGHDPRLAAGAVTVWAFAAGMLVALSTTAADLGVISLVTLTVYSATPLPFEQAVSAGLLALGGGLLQVLLSVGFWPLRRYVPERRALAAFFRELSASANWPVEATQSPPMTAASTAAQEALRTLERDHSVEGERFWLLLSQAERMRLSLLMLARLRVRIGREGPERQEAKPIERFVEIAAKLLDGIGESLETGVPAGTVPECQRELRKLTEGMREMTETAPLSVVAMVRDARHQMDALAGQLRASLELAASATPQGIEAFDRREAQQPWRLRLQGTVATLRANLSLQSAVFRHAIRLGVCVGIGDAVGRMAGLSRPYWLPMTVAIVLKPDFTATFSRGVLRYGGTFAGLLLATGLAHLFPNRAASSVVLVAGFLFAMRWIGGANYGVFVAGITGLVVFLFSLAGVAPKDVIASRAVNTLAGGGIALAAWALWPTWERTQVSETIARMLDAYRAYFRAIRDSYEHPKERRPGGIDAVRVPARLARSNAEASIERLVAEPGTPEAVKTALTGLLASSHRMVHAFMALEAGLSSSHPAPAREAFTAFAIDVELTLYYLAQGLRGSELDAGGLPDLRESHRALADSGDALMERYALVNVETDRITNSLNTLSGQVLAYLGR